MVSPFSIRNVRLFILIVMTVPAFIGLADMALFLPTLVGVIPIVLISSTMYLLRFFQSHYLNRITTSDQRATVLSFKGLSMNFALWYCRGTLLAPGGSSAVDYGAMERHRKSSKKRHSRLLWDGSHGPSPPHWRLCWYMLSGRFGEPVQRNSRRNLPDVVSARLD